MHYSPVRRSSASSKLDLLPLDLHVLSLPPAFNLSHDQTLQFNLKLGSGYRPNATSTTYPKRDKPDKNNSHQFLLKDLQLLVTSPN